WWMRLSVSSIWAVSPPRVPPSNRIPRVWCRSGRATPEITSMAAYIVSQMRTSGAYDAYRTAARELNRKYGARILTRPGTATGLEGNWQADALVIIEFESLEAAQRFYDSDEYKEVKKLREDAPPLTIVLVDGA